MVRLAASLVAVLAALAAPQEKPAPAPAAAPRPAASKFEWQHDWKSACDLAAEQKKPILVFYLNDAEPVCQRTLDGIAADGEAMKRIAGFVVVVASASTHELVDRDVGGRTIKTCLRYPGILCSEHQAIEAQLREKFVDASGAAVVPQFATFASDGTLKAKHAYAMKRDGFLEFLATGLAGAGGAAPAGAVSSPAVLKIAEAILDAKSDDEREHAARDLFADSSPEREAALQDVLARLKKPADKGVVIRAAGAPDRKAWAPAIATLLDDKDHFVRDCAVVTLEEERNPVVAPNLLQLWKTEKDDEVRKDVLRALGPCGAGNADAKKLVLEELASTKVPHRIACAMSLGALLPGNADAASALQTRFAKETNHDVRIAIVWGISESGDAAQAELIDRVLKGVDDKDLAALAPVAKERLRSNLRKAIKTLGKNAGPTLKRLLAPIYDVDKVQRNLFRDEERAAKK